MRWPGTTSVFIIWTKGLDLHSALGTYYTRMRIISRIMVRKSISTWNLAPTPSHSSTSTLMKTALSYLADNPSKVPAKSRHGPHLKKDQNFLVTTELLVLVKSGWFCSNFQCNHRYTPFFVQIDFGKFP